MTECADCGKLLHLEIHNFVKFLARKVDERYSGAQPKLNFIKSLNMCTKTSKFTMGIRNSLIFQDMCRDLLSKKIYTTFICLTLAGESLNNIIEEPQTLQLLFHSIYYYLFRSAVISCHRAVRTHFWEPGPQVFQFFCGEKVYQFSWRNKQSR